MALPLRRCGGLSPMLRRPSSVVAPIILCALAGCSGSVMEREADVSRARWENAAKAPAATAPAEPDADANPRNRYVGAEACKSCHEAEYGAWAKTAHAQSAEHVGGFYWSMAMTFQGDGLCYRCHATGWNE